MKVTSTYPSGKSIRELHTEALVTRPAYKQAYEDLADEQALAHVLIEARQEAGLSQKELAARMEVLPAFVSRLENGQPPSYRSLKRYAAALGKRVKVELI